MLSRFFISIIVILCIAHGGVSIPTKFKPTHKPKNEAEKANQRIIEGANGLVDKNALKMDYVLTHLDLPGHQDMVDAAFGTDRSLSMDHIKKTVRRVRTSTVPVKLASASSRGNTLGLTNYDDKKKNSLKPVSISLTDKFYAATASNDARAATLIHEATHYLSNTGDFIKDNTILPGNDVTTTNSKMYTSSKEPYRTPDELNRDDNWTTLRNGRTGYWGDLLVPPVKNMHMSAEAYTQFASMCGHAISDQTVRNHRPRPRSMEDGNWDNNVATQLIRRQVCSLESLPQKANKGKAASKVASVKVGKKAKPPKPTARDKVMEFKTGALSPKSRARVTVSGPNSSAHARSKGHVAKGIKKGLDNGGVRTSRSSKHPQLKVSVALGHLAPKKDVGQTVVHRVVHKASPKNIARHPVAASERSSVRPGPKNIVRRPIKSSVKPM